MNKTRARTIAAKHHSGPASPLYRYYRKGTFDYYGLLREINDALPYTHNTSRKDLLALREYVANHK